MKFLFPLLFFFCSAVFGWTQNIDSLTRNVEQYIDDIDPSIPLLEFVFEQNISDVSICKGPNHTYYLTGTTGDKFGVQEGIRVWASYDMKSWSPVGDNGYVWTFNTDAVKWQREISNASGYKIRGILSPQIHFFNNTFWISYTNSNSNRSGILKSKSGRAQGPYEEVSGEQPLIEAARISLFFDSDSTVYLISNGGLVYTMNKAMTGFVSSQPRSLTDGNGKRIGNGCIHVAKAEDRYVVSTSKWSSLFKNSKQLIRNDDSKPEGIDASFDGVVATSRSFLGNYTIQAATFPHAGGGHFFEDFEGNFWFTMSGEDVAAPVSENPSFMPLMQDERGEFIVNRKSPINASVKNQIVYVSHNGNNTTGNNWENAYTSIQRAIDNAPDGAQLWVAKGKYDAPVQVNLRNQLYLYGGFAGNEEALSQRNSEKNKVIIHGKNTAKHVISITSSNTVRIDGFTIQGGNASGESIHHQYGAGVHVLGGGETIRLVNCNFENNKADQDGGGLYASIGAAPIVINCRFKNNVSKNNGGAVAIYCNTPNGYHAKFYNCIFDNNFAYGDGGAIYFDTNKKTNGLLSIINCLIINNATLKEGGALTLDRNSNLLMVGTTLCFNKGTAQGAAVGSFGKVPAKSRVLNSSFYQNFGAVLFTIEGEAETVKNTENFFSPNVWVQFSNCLFDSNEVNALIQRNFDKRKWRNVIELNESVMGKNCTQGDPAFVDPYKGDFHLNTTSKARNTALKDFLFEFNLDLQPRKSASNIGCY